MCCFINHFLQRIEYQDSVYLTFRLDPYFSIEPDTHLESEEFSELLQEVIILIGEQLHAAE